AARATAQTIAGEASVSQTSAWLSARCRVMFSTASPWSMNASRSGNVPHTPPHSADFQTAVRRPITATPTAAPRAICETESTGRSAPGLFALAQHAPLHLAGRGHRQLGDELDLLRVLVLRELAAHVLLQLLDQRRRRGV